MKFKGKNSASDLLTLEVKFFRPMYNSTVRSNESSYEGFKEELFDIDHTWLYICYVTNPLVIGKVTITPKDTCVLRHTRNGLWELELCGKSTINTTVVQITENGLKELVKAVQFRNADFAHQPNPFGQDIQFRPRNAM